MTDRVTRARAELREAIAEFDKTAGAVPVTRLANAIEDVIDARLNATLVMYAQTNGLGYTQPMGATLQPNPSIGRET